jgi:hypothetical protein
MGKLMQEEIERTRRQEQEAAKKAKEALEE